jgi:hypothetical protein
MEWVELEVEVLKENSIIWSESVEVFKRTPLSRVGRSLK